MAPPELPDDRRAPPRRPPSAEHPVSVRNRDALPPDWPAADGAGPGQRNGHPGQPGANGSPHGPDGFGPTAGPGPQAPVAGAGPVDGTDRYLPVPPAGGAPVPGAARPVGPRPPGEQVGGGARSLPSPTEVLNGRGRPPQPGPGAAPPDGYPTDSLPVEPAPAAPPRWSPAGPDTTVEIGKAVPAAARADEPTGAADAAALAEGPRVSRRERRQAGELSGRPAAEFKKQHDELSRETRKKPRPGRRRRPAFWRELPLLVVVALLLTFLIQTFLAKVYVIPSGSMETTLHGCTNCNNDRVLVDKITYRFSEPHRGDVVVFRGPDSWSSEVIVEPPGNWLAAGLQQLGSLIGIAPPDEKDFVKRVIGTGGDVVQCCDSRNRVIVNGQPVDEPYVYYLPEAGPPRQDPFGPVTVPDGQLWMMGDSRNNSSDSRVAGHGPIPVENVIGKARLIVLPVNRFGWITSADPAATTAVGMAPGAGPPLALGALLVVPLVRRRRRELDLRSDRLDAPGGFLPDRRRWR